MGTPVPYALSMIRMIFSTVRAPQEPALTVESLAISATGRPSMVAVPVTTPSAGSPSASTLAYRPSSAKLPSSISSAIRSRANSLPAFAADSWYLRAPPCSMRARTSARSECSATIATVPGSGGAPAPPLCGNGPGPRTGAQHLGRQLTPDDAFRGPRRLDHRRQVDTGPHAHVLDHVHQFLGGDVAARARRVRAAAEPAHRRVEVVHAPLQRGEHVRKPGPAGVVEVQVERHVGVPGPERPHQVPHPARRRHA